MSQWVPAATVFAADDGVGATWDAAATVGAVCGIVWVLVLVLAGLRQQSLLDRNLGRVDTIRVAASADQQHKWVIAGDDRGIYGSAEAARLTREVLEWLPPAQRGEAQAVAHRAALMKKACRIRDARHDDDEIVRVVRWGTREVVKKTIREPTDIQINRQQWFGGRVS